MEHDLGHPGWHWEKARGTPMQNYKYCGKCCDDYKLPGHLCKQTRLLGPWEVGILPKANGSVALQTMTKMLQEGKTLNHVFDAFPATYMRYYRALQHVQGLLHNNNLSRGKPEIWWLWGASGAGKSRAVFEAFPHAYNKPAGNWWPKYQYQKTVIFDEFVGEIELRQLLRILDWHPLQTEIKGDFVNIKANRFVFTSNLDPRSLYKKFRWRRRQPFFRRLVEFGRVYKWDEQAGEFIRDDLRSFYETNNLNPETHDALRENQRPANNLRYRPY